MKTIVLNANTKVNLYSHVNTDYDFALTDLSND